MDTNEKTVQSVFFDRIKSKLSPEQNLVDTIAELLSVSDDSAYRRIRGDKLLNINDLQLLANAFNLSLDELIMGGNQGIFFEHQSIKKMKLDFNSYFHDMAKTMKRLQSAPGCKMVYAAMDVPIFHYFNFPEIILFKTYFWRKTIWEDPKLESSDFKLESLMKQHGETLKEDGNQILDAYINIPSVEIWHDWTIESTLRQIEFSLDSGFFVKKEDCQFLLEQMYKLIEHIEDQTTAGYKFKYGQKPEKKAHNYDVYLNEILFLSNTIIAETDIVNEVFVVHEATNYLISQDEKFCKGVIDWMEIQKRKAILITNSSEKIRNKFFKHLYSKVEHLMKKV